MAAIQRFLQCGACPPPPRSHPQHQQTLPNEELSSAGNCCRSLGHGSHTSENHGLCDQWVERVTSLRYQQEAAEGGLPRISQRSRASLSLGARLAGARILLSRLCRPPSQERFCGQFSIIVFFPFEKILIICFQSISQTFR